MTAPTLLHATIPATALSGARRKEARIEAIVSEIGGVRFGSCGAIQGDGATIARMKMRQKSQLPVKTCAHCGLPFTWRKKWERDWEQVKYCSQRCRRSGAAAAAA